MALPTDAASTLFVSAPMLPPDDQVSKASLDFERGGVALNDASQGLNVLNWRCFIAPNAADVMLQAENQAPVLAFTQPGVSEITFTFDQLMRPCIAFVLGLNTYLRWFDPVPQQFVVQDIGVIRDTRLALDDKRVTQLAARSDIILAYIRGTGLYYRQQRDRFLIERQLRDEILPTTRLRNVGMTRGLRLQFELV